MAEAPRRLLTAQDLDAARYDRWEIFDGEAAEKALPDFEHGQAQGTLRAAVDPYRRGSGSDGPTGWWFATEVRIQFELHHVYLPDIAGWRRDRHPERPSGRPVLAVPDWVCEVQSDTTRRRDLGVKLPVYHRRHVEHVWLVDPADRLVQVLRWSEPGYILLHVAGPGDRLRAEPFPAVEIDVSDLFGDPPPVTP